MSIKSFEWVDRMNILVVGLGLIGGSLCKALAKSGKHSITGCDLNKETEKAALEDGCIDSVFDSETDNVYDLVMICLYPEAAERYMSDTVPAMKDRVKLVTDVCGIKGEFARRMKILAENIGVEYIGMHPMAGKEFGGYENSTDDLFHGANIIITPFEDSSEENTSLLGELALELGAGKIVMTLPEEHDKMIAYTSQLAHIVSSAYVKSPVLDLECGFSGGSFQDMTRIATMNEKMWTDLFMQNRKNLVFELDNLIENLEEYSDALKRHDVEKMNRLIREGTLLKEDNLRKRIGQPN